jgi:hypothetical protein
LLEQKDEQTAGVMSDEEVEGPVRARPDDPSAMRPPIEANPGESWPKTRPPVDETVEVTAAAAEETTLVAWETTEETTDETWETTLWTAKVAVPVTLAAWEVDELTTEEAWGTADETWAAADETWSRTDETGVDWTADEACAMTDETGDWTAEETWAATDETGALQSKKKDRWADDQLRMKKGKPSLRGRLDDARNSSDRRRDGNPTVKSNQLCVLRIRRQRTLNSLRGDRSGSRRDLSSDGRNGRVLDDRWDLTGDGRDLGSSRRGDDASEEREGGYARLTEAQLRRRSNVPGGRADSRSNLSNSRGDTSDDRSTRKKSALAWP